MLSTDSVKMKKSEIDQVNNMRGSNKRVPQFSYIRVIACAAVVLLHTVNSARVYHADSISHEEIVTAYTACAILMWAVPCFLMVSGALLLDPARDITWSKILRKYVTRMLAALVIFTAIFTLIRHDPSSDTSIVFEFFNGLAFNHCMAYLWYLYLMIAIYLLLPLLRKAAFGMSGNGLWAFSVALIVIAIALQILLASMPDGSRALEGIASSLQLLIGCVAYVFMGRLIFTKSFNAGVATGLFIISTIALAAMTFRAGQQMADPSFISTYCSPLVVVQAASLYSLLLGIKAEAGSFIRSIDKCSFGIYLIHMIFVRISMSELGFDPFSYGPFGFALMSIILFFAAYGATWVIRNLLYMRRQL